MALLCYNTQYSYSYNSYSYDGSPQPPPFNGDIGDWDTSQVTDMYGMFMDCDDFNQDLNGWDTSSVSSMAYMFNNARTFNQNIGNWDTSSVTTMRYMFNGAREFNQDIGNWDTSEVTDMRGMFGGYASVFDRGLNCWSLKVGVDVTDMFGSLGHAYEGSCVANTATTPPSITGCPCTPRSPPVMPPPPAPLSGGGSGKRRGLLEATAPPLPPLPPPPPPFELSAVSAAKPGSLPYSKLNARVVLWSDKSPWGKWYAINFDTIVVATDIVLLGAEGAPPTPLNMQTVPPMNSEVTPTVKSQYDVRFQRHKERLMQDTSTCAIVCALGSPTHALASGTISIGQLLPKLNSHRNMLCAFDIFVWVPRPAEDVELRLQAAEGTAEVDTVSRPLSAPQRRLFGQSTAFDTPCAVAIASGSVVTDVGGASIQITDTCAITINSNAGPSQSPPPSNGALLLPPSPPSLPSPPSPPSLPSLPSSPSPHTHDDDDSVGTTALSVSVSVGVLMVLSGGAAGFFCFRGPSTAQTKCHPANVKDQTRVPLLGIKV